MDTNARAGDVPASRRSLVGLRAVNFFLAEVVGVIFAFLNDFLRVHQWSYGAIGVATASVGLGTFLFQTPAGVFSDRFKRRKLLLGCAALVLAACYGVLPLFVENRVATMAILFVSGASAAFFIPLLAALALSLVGRGKLDATMGTNQSWNHAGNIAAALLTLLMVKLLGIGSVFYVMTALSTAAAASLLIIRNEELNPDLARDKGEKAAPASGERSKMDGESFFALLRDPTVRLFLFCLTIFHVANAPVMPLVGLYLKKLGQGDVTVALVVLIAQVVMVPVAFMSGRLARGHGRKIVFSVAFVVLPIRILLYATTTRPGMLLAIQALDGISAGIYGVVTPLICSDLTRGKERFNSMMGLAQTAVALGAVVGPLAQGFFTAKLGFRATFIALGTLAAFNGVLFLLRMPETLQGAPGVHRFRHAPAH